MENLTKGHAVHLRCKHPEALAAQNNDGNGPGYCSRYYLATRPGCHKKTAMNDELIVVFEASFLSVGTPIYSGVPVNPNTLGHR